MEINEIRPFFVKAMGILGKLVVEKPEEEKRDDNAMELGW
jgi:hypothetical protein